MLIRLVSLPHRIRDDNRFPADKYDKYAEKFPPPVEKYMPGNRGDQPRKKDAPTPSNRGDAWADPWSRVKKSPKRSKKSWSGSPSRGRRRRRSYSRGSHSSSYSRYNCPTSCSLGCGDSLVFLVFLQLLFIQVSVIILLILLQSFVCQSIFIHLIQVRYFLLCSSSAT